MAELTYKNACIMYLEQNMECVNYRDYIIKQLNKLEQIENIVTKWYSDKSVNTATAMLKIKEVAEDGKID